MAMRASLFILVGAFILALGACCVTASSAYVVKPATSGVGIAFAASEYVSFQSSSNMSRLRVTIVPHSGSAYQYIMSSSCHLPTPYFLGLDDYWTDCWAEGPAGQPCTFYIDTCKDGLLGCLDKYFQLEQAVGTFTFLAEEINVANADDLTAGNYNSVSGRVSRTKPAQFFITPEANMAVSVQLETAAVNKLQVALMSPYPDSPQTGIVSSYCRSDNYADTVDGYAQFTMSACGDVYPDAKWFISVYDATDSLTTEVDFELKVTKFREPATVLVAGNEVSGTLNPAAIQEFIYTPPIEDAIVSYSYSGNNGVQLRHGSARKPVSCWKYIMCHGGCSQSFDKYRVGNNDGIIYFAMLNTMSTAQNFTLTVSSAPAPNQNTISVVSTTTLTGTSPTERNYKLTGLSTTGISAGVITAEFIPRSAASDYLFFSRLGYTSTRDIRRSILRVAPCALEKDVGDFYLATRTTSATSLKLSYNTPTTLNGGSIVTREIEAQEDQQFFAADGTVLAGSVITLTYDAPPNDLSVFLTDLTTLGCPRKWDMFTTLCYQGLCYLTIDNATVFHNGWIEVARTSTGPTKNYTLAISPPYPTTDIANGAKSSGTLAPKTLKKFSFNPASMQALSLAITTTSPILVSIWSGKKYCMEMRDFQTQNITLQNIKCGYWWDEMEMTNDITVILSTGSTAVDYSVQLIAKGSDLCKRPTELLDSSCAAYTTELIPLTVAEDEAIAAAARNLEHAKAILPAVETSTTCLAAMKEFSCRAASTRCDAVSGIEYPGMCFEMCYETLQVCGAPAALQQIICQSLTPCAELPPATVSDAPVAAPASPIAPPVALPISDPNAAPSTSGGGSDETSSASQSASLISLAVLLAMVVALVM